MNHIQGQRNRRLGRGIATALACRTVSAIVPIVMIPITLEYLGKEVYGLWMAVTALTAMAAFADLGLGNGLMTQLAKSHAEGDDPNSRRLISTAYGTLTAGSIVLCSILLVTSSAIPWSSLFNISNPALDESAQSIALICLVSFLINIPLSLIVRVQFALQQVSQSYLWQLSGPLISLGLVCLTVLSDSGSELVILAAVVGPLVANVLNTVWCFGVSRPHFAPRPSAVSFSNSTSLFRLGGMFFVLTVVMSLANNADPLIVTRVLSLEQVTDYSVPARIFAQVGLLVSLVSLPLWPANAEALASGDVDWVRRTTRRMAFISVAAVAIPSLVLITFGQSLLIAWVGPELVADTGLIAGLAVWWILLAAMSPIFMVQNSVGIVRPQLIGWTVFLVASVVAKVAALPLAGVWVLPWISAGVYAMIVVPMSIRGYRQAVEGASSQVSRRPA